MTVRQIARRLKNTPVAGGVRCPLCRGRFRRFLEHRGRPHARCPRCGALERHRVLALWLDSNHLFDADSRVLQMAPERSLERALKSRPHRSFVTADLRPGAADVEADITALPFGDSSFDVVICNHVLEHIPDDIKAMSELFRVLSPGGTALMMHPIDYGREHTYEDESITDPEERRRAFLQEDHVRIYGADFARRLESVGFQVAFEQVPRRLAQQQVKRYGLVPDTGGTNVAVPRMRADDVYTCVRPEAA